MVAAGSAAHAQVNPAGIEGVQHTEVFGHLEGAVMGEHDAAAADADGVGVGGHLTDQHFRAGAGEVGQVVVLRKPVAAVAQALHGHGQLDGLPQGVAGGAAGPHGRLVNNAEGQFAGQG